MSPKARTSLSTFCPSDKTYQAFRKSLIKRKAAQGSLEYIIIIGGVIILAAATYFMLRGFAQTTGAGTTETIGVAGEKYMLELENLGRSETRFSTKKWANPLLQKRTLMEFSSLGDVTFNATNLTAHGVQVSSLEFYFFDTSFHELNYTISGEILTVHTGSACCATDFGLYMFYNNLTALINPCLANYTGPPRISCGTIPLPDSSPPTINISSTAYGLAGSVVDAKINVTVNGTGSNVSEVYYSIDDSPWFPVNNLYYGQGGITAEAHPADGQYNEELEIIRITLTVPSEDNYTVRVFAKDEYGNEKIETREVSISVGEEVTEPTSPPVLSISFYPPQPFQERYLNFSATLSSTENMDWCRLKVNNSASEIVDILMDITPGKAHANAGTFAEDLYTILVNCSDSLSGEVSGSIDFQVITMTEFGDGQDTLNMTFGQRDENTTSYSVNDSYAITLPIDAVVTNASMTISGFDMPFNYSFNDRTDYPAGDNPHGVHADDFDKDGNLDLIIVNRDAANISFIKGNGDGTFQGPINYSVGTGPHELFVGDFDNNSNLDVVVINWNSNSFTYLNGTGDGSFNYREDYSLDKTSGSAITGGDFNEDGNLDVVTMQQDNGFRYFEGIGNGSFQPGIDYSGLLLVFGEITDVVSGDFNGDTHLDIVYSVGDTVGFPFVEGDGDGTFQNAVEYTGVHYPNEIYAADFDNDSDLDVITVADHDNEFGYSEGNGDGTFEQLVTYWADWPLHGIHAGDFDKDGDLDAVVTRPSGDIFYYFRNKGDGTFKEQVSFATGDGPQNIFAADYDKDGELEIIVTNGNADTFSYIENSHMTSSCTYPALDIGADGDSDWSYSGSFSTSEVFSGENLANEINSFLPDCSCSGCILSEDWKNCTILLNFSTDTFGNLVISNLEIEYAKPNDYVPPLIMDTSPTNNSYVPIVTLINISVTTNEDAHCRYSMSPGTPYAGMSDFDVTDGTTHEIQDVSLTYGENYKYYYRCNDTFGNAHLYDLVLNFTSDVCKGIALALLPESWGSELLYMDGDPIIAWEEIGNKWSSTQKISEVNGTNPHITNFDPSCKLFSHWNSISLYSGPFYDFQVSYFNEAAWEEVENITEGAMFSGGTEFINEPGYYIAPSDLDLSQDGSFAIAIWAVTTGSDFEIWAKEWDESWGTEVNISKSTELDINPAIAIAPDKSKALAVWVREGIGAMSAVWNSSTGWGTPTLADAGFITYVDVVFDEERAIAVFESNSSAANSQAIVAKEWTEAGGWDEGSRTVIYSSAPKSLFTPMIEIDRNGMPIVVWREGLRESLPGTSFNTTVSYAYEESEGSWTSPQNVSQGTTMDTGNFFSVYVDWVFPQSQLVHTGSEDLLFIWYDIDMEFIQDVEVYAVMWDGTSWSSPYVITTFPQTLLEEESCPYVYSFDGERYYYEHEAYPFAILESWEYETYEALEHLKPVDGHYLLQLREELQETSYTNRIGLRVVEHSPELEAYPDIHGDLHTIKEKIRPIACNDQWNGDCLGLVSESDSNALITDLNKVPLGEYSELRDITEVEFAKPEGIVKPKLMVRAMKTDFLAAIWEDQLELFGSNNVELMYYLLNDNPLFSNLLKGARERGVLRAEVWEGEEWKFADNLGMGLRDWTDVMLQLDEVDTETVKIRFESVVGTYTIDSLYLDYSEDEIAGVREAVLESAVTQDFEDVKEPLLFDDSSYITQELGDVVQLTFKQVPEDPNKTYSYVVNVKGYYLIEPPETFVDLDANRLLEIVYLWAIPGEGTRRSLIKYLDLPEDDSPERFAQAVILAFETVSVLFLFAVCVIALMVMEQKRKEKGKTKKKKVRKRRAETRKIVRKKKAKGKRSARKQKTKKAGK